MTAPVTALTLAEVHASPFFAASPLASWVFEVDGRRILAANDAACEMYGWSRDEFLRMRIDDMRPPEEIPKLLARLGTLHEAGPLRHSVLHWTRDLDRRHVEVVSRPLLVDGQRCRWVSVVEDAVDQRADEERRRADELVRLVLEAAPLSIYAVDREGVFSLAEGQPLLGVSPGELEGRKVADAYGETRLVTPQGPLAFAEVVRRVLAGQALHGLVMVGDKVQENAIVPTLDDLGAVRGYVGVARDVSEQRKLEEQLRQSQKLEAIGRLAGGIAHDFNNMLTVIGSACEGLLARVPVESPWRNDLEDIRHAADRSASLTRQLLAFSRQQVLQPRVIDVNERVSDTARLLGRLLGEDVRLELKLAAQRARVSADPGQLEQVIFNLAANAREAMPRGGRLTMETGNVELDGASAQGRGEVPPGRYVTLALTDEGTGMSPETLARAFEPFFTTKPPGSGAGMGLPAVYGIVRQSGGTVVLSSTQGKGTTARVYLPEVSAPVSPKPLPPAVRELVGTETLLVVEDEAPVRKVAVSALRALGYNVLAAANAQEALDLFHAHTGTIDLVITDIVMPGMDGRQLADRLRAERKGLGVLYVSGYTQDTIVQRGTLEEGAALLEKPFTYVTLARRVREMLAARSS